MSSSEDSASTQVRKKKLEEAKKLRDLFKKYFTPLIVLINSNYNPNGNNKVWFAEDIVVNLAKVNAFSSPQTVAITKVGLVRVLR